METRWRLFSALLTSLFKRSPQNHSRSTGLLSIPSVALPSGFFLSQTAGKPLADSASLAVLLRACALARLPESPPPLPACRAAKRDFCGWFWHFGVHFGALTAVQLAVGLDCPDPLCVAVDENSANLAFASIGGSLGRSEFAFPRMRGRLAHYTAVRGFSGAVQRGMIAAGNCLSAWEAEFRLHFTNVFGGRFEGGERLRRFSVLGRDVDAVRRDIEAVIRAARECEDPFVVPWI
jgi:hypothetical protein